MKNQIFTLTLGFALFGAVIPATAQPTFVTISAANRGYYESDYFTQGNGANYLAGINDSYRDWFLFDLSSASPGTIVSAQLMLLVPGTTYGITPESGHYYPPFDGASGSGTYQAWDVSTSVNDLENGTTLAATFTDLGGGVSYGGQTFSSADDGTFFTIDLNNDFLAAAQSALGSGRIAVGGSIDSGNGGLIFGWSGGIDMSDTKLVLEITPIPEPSTLAFAGLGVVGCVLLFCERRRQN